LDFVGDRGKNYERPFENAKERGVRGTSGTRFVDAHVHLSDPRYEPVLDEIIGDARKAGVVALVSNSMDTQTSLTSLKLAEKHSGLVFAALGIHPWVVRKLSQQELQDAVDSLTELSEDNRQRVVAIGEVGLDFTYVKRTELANLQRRVFREMLGLAEKLSLPVIIHSRGTAVEIVEILTSYSLKGALFHWFSGPRGLLPQLVDRGYYITEGPPVVYSRHIRENVKRMPLSQLLTETDGPVRFRGPFEGKVTSPTFIPMVVEEIAKLKNLSVAETAEQIVKNFTEFFNVKLV